MTVQVTFAGTTYTIPQEDDAGWSDLTDYLVALSDAQVGTTDTKAFRVATATPDLVSATDDYVVGVNVGSASVVTLPSGATGQIFIIFDASGSAATNNIVIGGTGGQTINGRNTYTIRSNYGAVTLQFGVSEWSVISAREITQEQNTTNLSMVDATVPTDNTGVSVSDLQSSTFTFAGPACSFVVSAGNKAMQCCCSVNSDVVDCIWDTDSMFLPTDSGTGVVVTKSTSTVTVKNRLGTSATFKIRAIVGQITSATAWS
jgi:hypothetical protein